LPGRFKGGSACRGGGNTSGTRERDCGTLGKIALSKEDGDTGGTSELVGLGTIGGEGLFVNGVMTTLSSSSLLLNDGVFIESISPGIGDEEAKPCMELVS